MLSRFSSVSADSTGLSVAGVASLLPLTHKQKCGRLIDKLAAGFLDALLNEVDDTQIVIYCQAKIAAVDRLVTVAKAAARPRRSSKAARTVCDAKKSPEASLPGSFSKLAIKPVVTSVSNRGENLAQR
jgi:hypothetical protein